MDTYLYCSLTRRSLKSTRRSVRPQSELVVNEVKLCLCGDSGVGKTSIATRFVRGNFPVLSPETIGASFVSKTMSVDGKLFRLHIWDTAGQERYRSLMPMYFREASAAIVVYDIARERTFESLSSWLNELNQHCQQCPIITLVGNKCDLDDAREVSFEEATHFAGQRDMSIFETSADTGHNIDSLFLDICRRLSPNVDDSSLCESIQLDELIEEEQVPRRRKRCC